MNEKRSYKEYQKNILYLSLSIAFLSSSMAIGLNYANHNVQQQMEILYQQQITNQNPIPNKPTLRSNPEKSCDQIYQYKCINKTPKTPIQIKNCKIILNTCETLKR